MLHAKSSGCIAGGVTFRHTDERIRSQNYCSGPAKIRLLMSCADRVHGSIAPVSEAHREDKSLTFGILVGTSADRGLRRTRASAHAGYPPDEGPHDGRREVPARGTSKVAGKCEVCHHASKPEKPLKSPQQACTDCHTKPPTPPVTTGLQAAFHNPTASAGLCITCHKTENSHGKAAPVKCADCHKRENS